MYLYMLTNKDNGKRFIGKSNFEKKLLKKLLFKALKQENHYNELLQKEFKTSGFELSFIDGDLNTIIEEDNLLNPVLGYNVFSDLDNNKGLNKKDDLCSEDLCLLYIFNPKVQFWVNVLGLERNTISNRISNHGLFADGYYKRNIARYEDYYWTAVRLLYIEDECMTANQLMDKVMHRHKVSSQLRITPRKISKFFSAHKVNRASEKVKGSVLFCPRKN